LDKKLKIVIFYSVKAQNVFEILIISSNDRRFGEFLKCFEIMFETFTDEIMEDFNSILRMVNVSRKKINGEESTALITEDYFPPIEYSYEWMNITDRIRITI